MRAIILFLFLVPYVVEIQTEPPDFLQKLIGTTNLQIGFKEDCYLTWYEKGPFQRNKDQKPTEFQCGKRSGSEIEIVPAENDRYLLKSGTKYMYWKGQNGDVKPTQFREPTPVKKGDTFWIRKLRDGMFTIGFDYGSALCPLYAKGSEGDTEYDAEFRCNEPVVDRFWIKGADCQAIKIEPVGDENQARHDGDEIIGFGKSASCSTANSNLKIDYTDEVTEEISVEFSKSDEVNWEATGSISFTGKTGLLGTGVETEVSLSLSHGGSKTIGSSEGKTTGISTSKSTGNEITFRTPGAGMVLGYVARYVFDHSNVPARVTAKCNNGHEYTFDTTIRLRSKVFGSATYSFETVKFKPRQCKQEYIDCVLATNFNSFLKVSQATEHFYGCFPDDSIEPKEKKKKIGKVKKEKTSSKSENKDSSK